jgi:hypothetical protein
LSEETPLQFLLLATKITSSFGGTDFKCMMIRDTKLGRIEVAPMLDGSEEGVVGVIQLLGSMTSRGIEELFFLN